MGIISLKYDYFFKHLMTNETIRKHFLSDVLGIPLNKIKSVRLANTFLWKMYRRQKLGILDVLLILNDNTKVNIELQIKVLYCRPPGFTVKQPVKVPCWRSAVGIHCKFYRCAV